MIRLGSIFLALLQMMFAPASVGVVGGADGPTTVFVATRAESTVEVATEPLQETTEEPEKTELQVWFEIDGRTIGCPNLLEKQESVAYSWETGAEFLLRVLRECDLEADYFGTETEDFYLQGLHNLPYAPDIAPGYASLAKQYSDDFDEDHWDGDYLGAQTFCSASGFLYLINGELPSESLSNITLHDGDTLTLFFTLCYGEDLAYQP